MQVRTAPLIAVLLLAVAATACNAQPAEVDIPDSQYVQVRGDDLVLDGKEVRFWGFIGGAAGSGAGVKPDDSPEVARKKLQTFRKEMDIMVQRIDDLGFNLIRSWEGRYPKMRDELPLLYKHDYQVGDESSSDGIAYPVTKDEMYVKVSLVSADGKPLATAGKLLLSAVSTSFNTGYKLKLPEKIGPETLRPFGGADMASSGDKPVLVARVGVTVTAPEIDGMTYEMKDFHLRTIAKGAVRGGKLVIPDDKAVFVVELTR